MPDPTVTHSTFTLERTYDVPAGRVFAAWADPAAKGRWFASPGAEHQLDFRVGGQELTSVRLDRGIQMTFESWYRDIVTDRRIIYASTLSMDDRLSTVSITTIEIEPAGDGSRLRLVEQGTFLDGMEKPDWREQGTGDWLDKLGGELRGAGLR